MKKKLLFINGHLQSGGVEKSLLDILTHLDYRRYEVDLLLLEAWGDYAPELPKEVHASLRSLDGTYGPLLRCLLRCIGRRDWFSLKMRLIFLLMRLFGQKRISLARRLLTGDKHYHCAVGFRSGICTQIAAFAVRADRRIAWWHHGAVNVDLPSYEEAARACDQIVAVSQSCRDMLAEAAPSLKEKLTVIPNMLDPAEIARKAGEFSPYRPERLPRLVTVGRLSPEKHPENVIFAACRLREHGVAFRWYWVGDGEMRRQLEELIQRRRLQDCVILTGNQPNPYPYIKHADLLVHPSYVESQGLAVLEAMCLGIPCVVTKSRGPCEFIVDGENGLLTEQSPEALAEQVERILRDRNLYEEIQGNTRLPAVFLPSCVMRKIEGLFGSVPE